MENVQVALLLRNTVKNFGSTSKTTTVVANDLVTFTFGPNNETALQFSLDQWNDIVNFVDGQLLQEFEATQDAKACCKCG